MFYVCIIEYMWTNNCLYMFYVHYVNICEHLWTILKTCSFLMTILVDIYGLVRTWKIILSICMKSFGLVRTTKCLTMNIASQLSICHHCEYILINIINMDRK